MKNKEKILFRIRSKKAERERHQRELKKFMRRVGGYQSLQWLYYIRSVRDRILKTLEKQKEIKHRHTETKKVIRIHPHGYSTNQ